jgi:hypothetical protein
LTGISSARVTTTAAVRSGSHQERLARSRASRVSGPSGTVSTITHGIRSIDRLCPDAGMIEHHGVPHQLASLLLGGVEPRLAQDRVVIEARDGAQERLGDPVLEDHLDTPS